MKKLLLFLLLLTAFHAKADVRARVQDLKAVQLPNGDIRFYIEVRAYIGFSKRLDSIKVRNDTVELYFCIQANAAAVIQREFYTQEFTPSGAYTSYKGKAFVNDLYPDCNFLDSSVRTLPFTLSLPLTDTAYILDVPKTLGSVGTVLFPNPTNGSVNIAGTLKYEKFLVTNTFGQTVLEVKQQHAFSLAGLPAGLYFVRFFDRQGLTVESSRMVKE